MPAKTPAPPSRSLAITATGLCLLAVVAAVVAFVNGSWFGIVWVLLAGVTSNMAWYHWRRLRALPNGPDGAPGTGPDAGSDRGPGAGPEDRD